MRVNIARLAILGGICASGALLGWAYLNRNIALLFLALALGLAVSAVAMPRVRSTPTVLTVALLLALATGELIAGGVMGQPGNSFYDPLSSYRNSYWAPSDLGSQATAGAHGARKLAQTGDVIYDVVYTIGEDGFRVTEQTAGRARRVNFFGCSFTFGEGLNDRETLPYYVAQQSDLQVKNFGFHGYGAHQAFKILSSDRDTAGEVNFFLTAAFHATRSACKHQWTAGSPRYAMVGDALTLVGSCEYEGAPSGVVQRIARHSTLYRLLQKSLRERVTDADIELYLALVDGMYRVSQSRGQRFVIGFIGSKEEKYRGTTYSNQRLVAALQARSDAVIDLSLREPSPDGQSYVIHPLDRHPSARANAVRAQMIVRQLQPTNADRSLSRAGR